MNRVSTQGAIVNPVDKEMWYRIMLGDAQPWRKAFKALSGCVIGTSEQLRFWTILMNSEKVLPLSRDEIEGYLSHIFALRELAAKENARRN